MQLPLCCFAANSSLSTRDLSFSWEEKSPDVLGEGGVEWEKGLIVRRRRGVENARDNCGATPPPRPSALKHTKKVKRLLWAREVRRLHTRICHLQPLPLGAAVGGVCGMARKAKRF